MKLRLLTLFSAIIILSDSCSSGKSAYKHGDYYDAVLAAVQRLRQKPDHKKSKEILSLSYQLAVEYLETDAQNQVASNANFKWRTAVQDYEKINHLYDEIRTSPGAMKIIPKPVNKFNELTDAKGKAAEESYEAGIQAMLKNDRESSKEAYYLFKDASIYSPGFRESVEMINQAEYNATLRVAYDQSNASRDDLNLLPAVESTERLFLKFFPINEALNSKIPIDQTLKLVYRGCYTPLKPNITQTESESEKEIKVGEKDVAGKKEPVMEKVKAKVVVYTATLEAKCSCNAEVTENKSNSSIYENTVSGNGTFTARWATYTGDARALSAEQKELTTQKLKMTDPRALEEDGKKNLRNNLANELKSFYSRY